MTYAILTFGCRVNAADSLAIEAALVGAGARATAVESADLVLVNTCSVTASADQAARQAVRRIARTNPAGRVVVTGCYATRRPGQLEALPGVAAVIPNVRKDDPEALVGALLNLAGSASLPGDGPCGAAVTPGIAGRTAWTLAVQTGCDQRCSYCVVPQTRGAGRSVPVDDVLTALDRRVSGGFREIVLTGVHLGSYGRDLQPRGSLAALLRRIAAMLEGQRVRVRVSSIEPMDCGDDVIDVMTGHACFAPHFHLPLQHASARVLARMRRPYSPQAYARTVGRIRAVSPRAAIGSDVLVGFPGEREPDVELLCDYLVDSPLTHLHVFPYSERPGTEAATHGDSVPSPAVKDRAARVRQVAACLQTRFRRAQLGTSHEALTLEDGTRALTGNYCKVTIPAGRGRNQWVELRVTGDDGDLHGEVLDPGAVAPRA